jgi:putative transcriptional regulator
MKNKLKIIRTEKDFNQTEFAERCQVSRQTIHSIEVDKYTPSVELALKIAKNLNKKVEDIFFLEDVK